MNGDGKPRAKARRRRACPICGKAAVEPHVPFCSRDCADLDLGLWFRGAYRIPAVEPPDEAVDAMTEDEGAGGAEPGEDEGGE
ncbi:MAG: DNA gyrase inhibitor YacG [Alphaproteobacteria bacterium]|nr:DNA gyrase inhibitor YacG [Alphaproteobacteria bacterium]